MNASFSKSLFLAAFAAFSIQAQAEVITLDTYLQQVEKTSPAVKAGEQNVEGSLQSAKVADLPFMPKLTVDASHQLDNRVQFNPFVGNHTTQDNLGFGLEKQFDFGLDAKISYGLINNFSSGISPLIYPSGNLQYSEGQTQIDLTLPLWRNFLGGELKATAKQDEATSLKVHYDENYKLKQTRAEAESAYFRLAVARESIKLKKEVLDRSQKILDWTNKRVRSNLTDRIDYLQARASFQSGQLDLQSSLDEERTARLDFNSFRNSESNEVPEELAPISTDQILSITVFKKADVTDDVKAAEQQQVLDAAKNELSLQKAQPDLSLYTTAAFNGVDQYLSPAVKASLTTDHPMYVVGVKLSFPLYFWETSEIRAGFLKQELASESNLLQKKLASDQNWIDWTRKLDEAKSRLKMAEDLVQAQKEKVDYEHHRFSLGRTTTYQVLTFEQDYAQSLIVRLNIESEILNTHSKMKTLAAE